MFLSLFLKINLKNKHTHPWERIETSHPWAGDDLRQLTSLPVPIPIFLTLFAYCPLTLSQPPSYPGPPHSEYTVTQPLGPCCFRTWKNSVFQLFPRQRTCWIPAPRVLRGNWKTVSPQLLDTRSPAGDIKRQPV